MVLNRGRLIAVVTALVAAPVLIIGCGSTSSTSSASHASTTVTSPFTGEPVSSLGPELIFKIDNVSQARPPTGLTHADLVYILPVDAGLSRIYAVFSSDIPPVVGPVRSARQEDIELNAQFGTPAFAYSGAQPQLLPVVEHSRIIDLYSGKVAGYYRDNSRVMPYNLYAHTSQLLAEAGGASKAHDIGLVFGSAPAGGTPASSYAVTYPSARFGLTWSASSGKWLVSMDGTAAMAAGGGQLGAPTVVVQYVKVTKSPYMETGGLPPYANTVGSGTAVVLRDGRSYQAHWSRPDANSGTAFTRQDGSAMPFARGQVWVIFAYGPGSQT